MTDSVTDALYEAGEAVALFEAAVRPGSAVLSAEDVRGLTYRAWSILGVAQTETDDQVNREYAWPRVVSAVEAIDRSCELAGQLEALTWVLCVDAEVLYIEASRLRFLVRLLGRAIGEAYVLWTGHELPRPVTARHE